MSGMTSKNVLLVDDSPAMRRVVRRVLELSGFPCGEIYEAEDGLDALDRMAEHSVDLLITDINMPRMNGEELVAALSSDPRLRAIPVIVVSTDATHARAEKLLTLGARGYISKPFTPEELATELARIFTPVEVV